MAIRLSMENGERVHDRGPIPGAHLDLNCLETIQEIAQICRLRGRDNAPLVMRSECNPLTP
jgi:hypothetical protein